MFPDDQSYTYKDLLVCVKNLRGKKYILGAFVALGYLVYLLYTNYLNLVAYEIHYDDETEIEDLYVELAGAVKNPGVYNLPKGSRIYELLSYGGPILNESSNQWVSKKLNLSEQLVEAQKVYIPFEWELVGPLEISLAVPSTDLTLFEAYEPEPDKKTESVSVESGQEAESDSTEPTSKINLNTASQSELESLKGIGKVYSQRIIDNRPYTQAQDVIVKANIPESTFEKIKDFVEF
jgi:competence protein ComEA